MRRRTSLTFSIFTRRTFQDPDVLLGRYIPWRSLRMLHVGVTLRRFRCTESVDNWLPYVPIRVIVEAVGGASWRARRLLFLHGLPGIQIRCIGIDETLMDENGGWFVSFGQG